MSRADWESVPLVYDVDDYEQHQEKVTRRSDAKGVGSPADAGVWSAKDQSVALPEPIPVGDERSKGADQESEALRNVPGGIVPAVGSPDDVNVVSAADGDVFSRRVTNPRYAAQQRAVGDLVGSAHGFLTRKLGSQMQRILKCERCRGPIPVDIEPADFPCECGSLPDDPARESCRCAGCLGYRQALTTGYVGKGRPPKYCSDRCCKDAKNTRLRARRAVGRADLSGIEVGGSEPTIELAPVTMPLTGYRLGLQIAGDHPLAEVFGAVRLRVALRSGLEGINIRDVPISP
jgi:hypothetical protein